MSDDAKSEVPAVRRSDLSPNHMNSRLMKRGLMALDESHMKPLNVLRLIAFESSVFVLSADWDAHASLEQDFSDEYFGTAFHGEYFSDSSGVDDLKKRRQLVFYEFSRTGVFVQRLVLALHNLTDEGYSQIEGRSPGRPIVGAHFVHFHENIALVGILESVRIDYLFSRNGERLAIWANDLFFDRFRAPFEPQIPSEVAFHPESASSDWLIAFPHHEDYSLGNDLEVLTIQRPELHVLDFEDVTSLYVGVFCDYRTLTDAVNKASASSLPLSRELPTSLAKYSMTRFKMMLRTYAGHWNRSISSPSGAWFLNEEFYELWKLEVSDNGEVSSQYYSFPHPLDLVRDGMIQILGEGAECWIPDEEDYRNFRGLGFGAALPLVMHAWGDDVVVSVRWDTDSSSGSSHIMLVLFEAEGGELKAVRAFDPIQAQWCGARQKSFLPQIGTARFHIEMIQRRTAYSDDHLYSVSGLGAHDQTIVVTNAHTESVTWFQPKVPERDLK